jgi:hypothetical protein
MRWEPPDEGSLSLDGMPMDCSASLIQTFGLGLPEANAATVPNTSAHPTASAAADANAARRARLGEGLVAGSQTCSESSSSRRRLANAASKEPGSNEFTYIHTLEEAKVGSLRPTWSGIQPNFMGSTRPYRAPESDRQRWSKRCGGCGRPGRVFHSDQVPAWMRLAR